MMKSILTQSMSITPSIFFIQSLILKPFAVLLMIVFATALIFFPTQVNAQNSGSSLPDGFSLFEDPARGYTIIYPSDAQKEEVPVGTHFKNEKDGWSFGVLGPSPLGDQTLQQLVKEIADFERELGFNVLDDDKELQVGGLPAQMMTREDDLGQRWWKIWVQDGADYYELQIFAPKDSFESYTDMFYTMLKSIKFTNN
ncbi:hypothetical protein [Candidatus Nitrosocosmicus sp. T]